MRAIKKTLTNSIGLLGVLTLSITANAELVITKNTIGLTAYETQSDMLLSLTVVGPNGEVSEQRGNDASYSWYLPAGAADGVWIYEAVSMPDGDNDEAVSEDSSMSTESGRFEVNGGLVEYVGDDQAVNQVNDNSTRFLLLSFIGKAVDWLFASAYALDLSIHDATPDLRFDDTDVAPDINEWIVTGDQNRFRILNEDTNEDILYIDDEADMQVEVNSKSFQLQDNLGNEILHVHEDSPSTFVINENGDLDLGSKSIYVDRSTQHVGFGTSAPVQEIHISDSTPVIRFSGGDVYDVGEVNNNGDFVIKLVSGGANGNIFSINDTSGHTGIWDTQPDDTFTVGSPDGESAKVLVQNTTTEIAARTLFELQNRGNTKFTITNTDASAEWSFANPGDSLRFSLQGSGDVEFQLDNNGDLEIAGVLTENSDVNSKQDIVEIKHQAILEKVVQLPIKEWSYKDAPQVRHIGPMAQDFHKAFGLGHTDTGIATLDTTGVALAAIQALKLENNVLSKKVAEIDTLKSENEQLRIELNAMKEQLTQVENLQRRVIDFLAQASQPDMQQVSY